MESNKVACEDKFNVPASMISISEDCFFLIQCKVGLHRTAATQTSSIDQRIFKHKSQLLMIGCFKRGFQPVDYQPRVAKLSRGIGSYHLQPSMQRFYALLAQTGIHSYISKSERVERGVKTPPPCQTPKS